MAPDQQRAKHNQIVQWCAPPPALTIEAGEIHVWRAALDVGAKDVTSLASTLSSCELQRSMRFRFERDRRSFIVRRGILRTLLGRYVDALPCYVVLAESAYGKPFLAHGIHKTADVRFNLSHSDDVAIYAFARQQNVGIDIERIRPFTEADAICQKYFAREEREMLGRMTGDRYWRAFFNCWTRKEAYLKAEGRGLSGSLDNFVVLQAMGSPYLKLRSRRPHRVSDRWVIVDFNPSPGYQAALTAGGPLKAIHYWRVSSSSYNNDQAASVSDRVQISSQEF